MSTKVHNYLLYAKYFSIYFLILLKRFVFSWRGMADELQELHYLKGAQFINQLKLIIYHGEFSPVEGENDIYSAISEQSDDFDNLINAARKAVEHGYRVYILAILAPFQQKG